MAHHLQSIALSLTLSSVSWSPLHAQNHQLDNDILVEKAEEFFRNEQFKDAYVTFNTVLETNPNHAAAIYKMEICNAMLGLRPNCHKMNQAVRLGHDVTEQEMFFYGCVKLK